MSEITQVRIAKSTLTALEERYPESRSNQERVEMACQIVLASEEVEGGVYFVPNDKEADAIKMLSDVYYMLGNNLEAMLHMCLHHFYTTHLEGNGKTQRLNRIEPKIEEIDQKVTEVLRIVSAE